MMTSEGQGVLNTLQEKKGEMILIPLKANTVECCRTSLHFLISVKTMHIVCALPPEIEMEFLICGWLNPQIETCR